MSEPLLLSAELCSALSLLEEQPSWLAHPELPLENRNRALNPRNVYSWRDSAAMSRPGADIVWVGDRAVNSASPFPVGQRLRKLIDEQRAAPSQDADERALGVLSAADILIDEHYPIFCEARRAELAYAAALFQSRGYVSLGGLIHPFHVGQLRLRYRRLLRTGCMSRGDCQSPLRYVLKNEALAGLHHCRLAETMSLLAGRPVKTSYVYASAYQGGARLPRHVDRPQCEYSLTFCLDFTPHPTFETSWPLHLDTPDGIQTIYQSIGDALVYRGRTIPHYRDALPVYQSSTSLFFHYVDADFQGDLR